MEMYFYWLCKKLDLHKTGWRDKYILILDGATYHCSAATQKILKKLRIPVMYLGPHSYDAQPGELWFAWFKKCDINFRKVPLGKR